MKFIHVVVYMLTIFCTHDFCKSKLTAAKHKHIKHIIFILLSPTNTKLTSYIRHNASNTCTGIWSLCAHLFAYLCRPLLIINKMLENTFLSALHLNFHGEVVSVQSPLSRFMICIRHLHGWKVLPVLWYLKIAKQLSWANF